MLFRSSLSAGELVHVCWNFLMGFLIVSVACTGASFTALIVSKYSAHLGTRVDWTLRCVQWEVTHHIMWETMLD